MAPRAIGSDFARLGLSADIADRQLNVTLTKDQIENSPGIEAHETVSRQHEQHMAKYYGWPVYWPVEGALAPDVDDVNAGDANLRSASEVKGYHVHAKDGDLGHVVDFLVDETTWSVRTWSSILASGCLARRFWSTRATDQVDWAKSAVHVHLTKDQVKSSPTYDPTGAREALDRARRDVQALADVLVLKTVAVQADCGRSSASVMDHRLTETRHSSVGNAPCDSVADLS